MRSILARGGTLFLVLLPLTVYAAVPSVAANLEETLSELSVMSVVIAVLLAIIGGAAATLQRVAAAKDMSRWKLEVMRDLSASIVSGLIVFFVLESMQFNAAREAAVVTLSGFAGSTLLDHLTKRFLNRIDQL
jgi:hypothetical protein